MASPVSKIKMTSYDDLFKNDEERCTEEIKPIPLSELKPFEEQPFKVLMDESMDELVDSIKQNGVLTPIVARPHKDGGYEILSGHRRVKACEIAGITVIPVVIKNLDDDTATILLVDSNLQRENILPSEKAFAYQLKLEAMKRKAGRPSKENSDQIGYNLSGQKSIDVIAENSNDSRNQIQRYIRLTNLVDPLLEMVDEKKIAFNAAVEVSYLNAEQQADLLDIMEKEQCPPSISQAQKMKKLSAEDKLTYDVLDVIMSEQKDPPIKIVLKEDKLRKYFPKSYTAEQIEQKIFRILDSWHKKQMEQQQQR